MSQPEKNTSVSDHYSLLEAMESDFTSVDAGIDLCYAIQAPVKSATSLSCQGIASDVESNPSGRSSESGVPLGSFVPAGVLIVPIMLAETKSVTQGMAQDTEVNTSFVAEKGTNGASDIQHSFSILEPSSTAEKFFTVP